MIRRLRQLRVFTTNTMVEAFRNKTLYAVMIAAVLAMAAANIFGAVSLRQDERIFNNFILFAGMLFLSFVAIYQGVTTIHREVDTKTIFTVVSKPVTRGSFLVGKYVASSVILGVCTVLMFGLASVVALSLGYEITALHVGVYYAVLLQLLMIVAIGFLFSTFSISGPLLSALFTFSIFLIGNLTPQLENASREFAADGNPLHHFLDITLLIVPDLEKYNLSYELTHKLEVPTSYFLHATGYALTVIVFSLLIAHLIFSRRDFA